MTPTANAAARSIVKNIRMSVKGRKGREAALAKKSAGFIVSRIQLIPIVSGVAKSGAVSIRMNAAREVMPARLPARQDPVKVTRSAAATANKILKVNIVSASVVPLRARVSVGGWTAPSFAGRIPMTNIARAKKKSIVSNIRTSAARLLARQAHPKVGKVPARVGVFRDPAVAGAKRSAVPIVHLIPMILNVRVARRSRLGTSD